MSYIKNLTLAGGLLWGLAGCVEAPPPAMRTVNLPATAVRYSGTPPRQTQPSRRRAAPRPALAYSPWQQLPDWQTANLLPSWTAFRLSCQTLRHKVSWHNVCVQSDKLRQPNNEEIHAFFEREFVPRQLVNRDGSTQGKVTGYYEPKLYGSYQKTARFRYPLYATPDSLNTANSPYRRVNRYYSRAEIKSGKSELSGRELFWVDNEVELFFMQIQGSGRIELPNGQLVRVGHAGNNGYPYQSIGKQLVAMGELPLNQASMWDIKDWGARNPQLIAKLIERNPRYVFFRELPSNATAPVGALGVPLTEGYSIAVDPQAVPLGAPVFLSTTYPNSNKPLNRLMLAQDTGIAIKGSVRADFFWGYGQNAEAQAGRMKQAGKMWVLLPRKATEGRVALFAPQDTAALAQTMPTSD